MCKEFIDLGLPSGNLWATVNEVAENGQPMYSAFNKAVETYGNNLPTIDDWQELIDNVPHLWDKQRQGLLFIARNGNELFLPALGSTDSGSSKVVHKGSGLYQSASSYSFGFSNYLIFDKGRTDIWGYHWDFGLSVRLIKRPINN